MRIILTVVLTMLLTTCPGLAMIQGGDIEYVQGDTPLVGYLAYDDSFEGMRPGVLIVHDWLGMGPYVKQRADQLAALGYVAFAADIYGKGVRPANNQEAAKIAGEFNNNRPLMRARVNTGLNVLRSLPQVDHAKLAAIGYCFGGTTVLELARSGADVLGVISFHGGLSSPTPEDARNIKAKVLVLHGADDPNMTQAPAFQNEMRLGKVDWQMTLYGNAVHAFTIPTAGNDNSKGSAYNKLADQRSFEAMLVFFRELFGE